MNVSIVARCSKRTVVLATGMMSWLWLCGSGIQAAVAQDGPAPAGEPTRAVPDTYTAVTAGMTPSGVNLRFVVTDWSSEDERAAVVAALGDASDPQAALSELPTMGVVWRDNSAVGTAIKYAGRRAGANGEEIVTLVTEEPLGPLTRPWTAEGTASGEPKPYTVIEFDASDDGAGTGTMSYAADVLVDADSKTVALDRNDATPSLLAEVARVPKPYWAAGN